MTRAILFYLGALLLGLICVVVLASNGIAAGKVGPELDTIITMDRPQDFEIQRWVIKEMGLVEECSMGGCYAPIVKTGVFKLTDGTNAAMRGWRLVDGSLWVSNDPTFAWKPRDLRWYKTFVHEYVHHLQAMWPRKDRDAHTCKTERREIEAHRIGMIWGKLNNLDVRNDVILRRDYDLQCLIKQSMLNGHLLPPQ